jgi:hypothetical protein
MTVTELRQKHPRLIYQKYEWSVVDTDIVFQFHFLLEPGLQFTTILKYHSIPAERLAILDREIINNWALQIGMVESLSYWKTACPAELVIEAGYFNEDQLSFWLSLLQKGLSEFFFTNHINGWEKDFVRLTCSVPQNLGKIDKDIHQEKYFVPLGGGKDSVVTLELLKELQLPVTPLVLEAAEKTNELIEVAQLDSATLKITRTLDPQLATLNKQGYLNGHTPFSAMMSFVMTLASYLVDIKYIAVSNEFSANEGNTTYLGQLINHQYSKSLEYETLFREYCQKYLSNTIEYFSALRPIHELQIAYLFAHYPKYFPHFLSCNRGQKTSKWCGECPKCLFVFIMLSPWVAHEQLISIFGQDLLNKASLRPILDELTGVVECKSFECVGTRQETLFALFLTLKNSFVGFTQLPVLLSYAQAELLPKAQITEQQVDTFLHSMESNHFVPKQIFDYLKKKLS